MVSDASVTQACLQGFSNVAPAASLRETPAAPQQKAFPATAASRGVYLLQTAKSWSEADQQWDQQVAKLRVPWEAATGIPTLDALRQDLFDTTFQPVLDHLEAWLKHDPTIQAEVLTTFYSELRGSTWAWRCHCKPLGYAGDYLAIELLYTPSEKYRAALSGWAIDKWCRDTTSGRAVILRRQYLTRKIHQAVAQSLQSGGTQGAAHVMCLASGPAAEILNYIKAHSSSSHPEVTFYCLDNDAEALRFAEQRFGAHPHTPERPPSESSAADLVMFIKANVLHASSGKKRTSQLETLPGMDLIYSAGLIDYLSPSYIIAIADWAFGLLRPGGKLVLGNFSADNDGMRGFLDMVLLWKLNYRTPDELVQMMQASSFGKHGCRIFVETGGNATQLFVVAVKNGPPDIGFQVTTPCKL